MNTVKDPVCGMMVDPEEALSTSYQGRLVYFCSDLCKRSFLTSPEKYLGTSAGPIARSLETTRRIAYFSMEVAGDPRMPTYSGGLGLLAGDTLRSCADLKIPIVGVRLLLRPSATFNQRIFTEDCAGTGSLLFSPAKPTQKKGWGDVPNGSALVSSPA